MTTYTLDVSKWRCGGESRTNSLGIGPTKMLNQQGYMCCLGQFSGQDPDALLDEATPACVAKVIGGEAYDSNFVIRYKVSGNYEPTDLAGDLMEVNDDKLTSPAEKVEQIRALLAQEGHELMVIDEQNLLGDKS